MWQVNEYIDPKDVGLDAAWCPLVYGKEALGCQRPTFEQLLQVGGPNHISPLQILTKTLDLSSLHPQKNSFIP